MNLPSVTTQLKANLCIDSNTFKSFPVPRKASPHPTGWPHILRLQLGWNKQVTRGMLDHEECPLSRGILLRVGHFVVSSAALPAEVSNVRASRTQGERADPCVFRWCGLLLWNLMTKLLYKNREIRRSGAWPRQRPGPALGIHGIGSIECAPPPPAPNGSEEVTPVVPN